jgi:hypothetical protein
MHSSAQVVNQETFNHPTTLCVAGLLYSKAQTALRCAALRGSILEHHSESRLLCC